MERTVAVLHKGALAYYNVSYSKKGEYSAHLLKYNGSPDQQPPQEFKSHKEGRHWSDKGADQELLDDIGCAIELFLQEQNGQADNRPRMDQSGDWQQLSP